MGNWHRADTCTVTYPPVPPPLEELGEDATDEQIEERATELAQRKRDDERRRTYEMRYGLATHILRWVSRYQQRAAAQRERVAEALAEGKRPAWIEPAVDEEHLEVIVADLDENIVGYQGGRRPDWMTREAIARWSIDELAGVWSAWAGSDSRLSESEGKS